MENITVILYTLILDTNSKAPPHSNKKMKNLTLEQ